MNVPGTFLSGFTQAEFGAKLQQKQLCEWMSQGVLAAHPANNLLAAKAASRFEQLVEADHIAFRRSCVADLAGRFDPKGFSLFRENQGTPWHSPGIEPRMQIYTATTRCIFEQLFPEGEPAPDLLVQTTCTGYEAPTAAQRLAAKRQWAATRLLQFGHMGCYAALPTASAVAALVAQKSALQGKDACASVVCVELCTLHLQVPETRADQVIIHYLFGDGAVRFDITTQPRGPGLAFIDHFETIVPHSADDMTWTVSNTGFRMTLARDVPEQIGKALPGAVQGFLARHGLYRSDINHWAIHPGGTRIIDQVAACLELNDHQTAHSRTVFRHHGNMSSATIPTVWQALLEDQQVPPGALVVSLAFGPGLSLTANLLRKVV